MKRKGLLSLIIGLLALRAASAEDLVTLKGHVPKQIQNASKVGEALDSERVDLTLTVQLDAKALDQALADMYGKNAPKQRHYLTPTEFAQKFGMAEKRQKIKEFAQANGLTVDTSANNPNSQGVKVFAGARVVEKAFHVKLHHYRDAKGRVFHAIDTDPMIPASLSPHLGAVLGLSNNVGVVQPLLKAFPVYGNARSVTKAVSGETSGCTNVMNISGGTGPCGTLSPSDIKAIYGLNQVSQNGAGQTLALFESDGYIPTDSVVYESSFSLSATPVNFKGVDGMTNLCGSNQDSPCNTQTFQSEEASSYNGMLEVGLDIDMMEALAPKAFQILVYEGPSTTQGTIDTYNQIAIDNTAKAISTSWGWTEQELGATFLQAENQTFKQMACQGQTIYAASGDNGAYGAGNTTNANDPASQPNVTAVGGTSLSGSIAAPVETTWSGSGGGVSGTWPLPSYQVGVLGVSEQFRNVPDVALNADPNSGYGIFVGGTWYQVGGTSAAAPLWAAMTALLNQNRSTSGEETMGFANPFLYSLGLSAAYSTVFNDITIGNNGLLSAGPGYDNTTGWGSYKGAAMISASPGSNGTSMNVIISTPTAGATYAGPVSILGSASGPNFVRYQLAFSSASSGPWTFIIQSSQPVTDGLLGVLNVASLSQGAYWIRLTAENTSNVTYGGQTWINVQFAAITNPAVPVGGQPFLALSSGTSIPIQILGTAGGPGFKNYAISWAEGISPSRGWSTTGVTSTGNGQGSVVGGLLGVWDASSLKVADFYTIRLDVNFGTSTQEVQTFLFLDPDMAPGWPQRASGYGLNSNLVISLHSVGADLYDVGQDLVHYSLVDGSYQVLDSIASLYEPPRPVVTDFGSQGRVMVIPVRTGSDSSDTIFVTRPDGSYITLNTPLPIVVGSMMSVDLNGDGIPEIVVAGNRTTFPGLGVIYAFEPNGQQLSANYPIQMTESIPVGPAPQSILTAPVTGHAGNDLFVFGSSGLHDYASDGTNLGTIGPSYAGKIFEGAILAPLDASGNPSIIFGITYAYNATNYGNIALYAVSLQGTMRAGWPTTIAGDNLNDLAAGDLMGDGRAEIVTITTTGSGVFNQINALSPGGSLLTGWPLTGSHNEWFTKLRIADLDGDGVPEIVVGSQVNGSLETWVKSFHANGTAYKTWQMTQGGLDRFGNPSPPCNIGDIVIGDLDGNGKTDMAVEYTINELPAFAQPYASKVSLYRLNTRYKSTSAPWPMAFHDPLETSALSSGAGSPLSGTSFVTQTTPGTLRNNGSMNYTGWVGFRFQTGSQPLLISQLGRFVAPGDAQAHTVKIWQEGNTIPLSSTTVDTSGAIPGHYVYGYLPSTVTLLANSTYYIASYETFGADPWYDDDTVVVPTADGAILNAVFGDGISWNIVSTANHSYVPVNFLYTVTSVPPPPPDAAQFISQVVPSSMTAGQPYPVTVVMQNTGSSPWTEASQFHLGSQNPQDNATWGSNRAFLRPRAVVNPGQSASFTFTVTAPATAGTYNFQWEMVQDGVTWFRPATPNVSVQVLSSGTSPNVALNTNGATAMASSEYVNGQYPVSSAITGNRTGAGWGTSAGGWNDNTVNVYPDWLEVDFAGTKNIQEVDVYTVQDGAASLAPTAGMTFSQYGITDFEVQYYNGSVWVDVPDGQITGNNLVWRQLTFASISTARIRILVNNSLAGYSRIVNVEAYESVQLDASGNVVTTGLTNTLAGGISVNVYPNPWKSSLGVSSIEFKPVPDGSTIRIFTVSGHWVKTLSAPNGSVPWDLTNDSGEKVASGIYLYLLTDPQGDKAHGKVVVIR